MLLNCKEWDVTKWPLSVCQSTTALPAAEQKSQTRSSMKRTGKLRLGSTMKGTNFTSPTTFLFDVVPELEEAGPFEFGEAFTEGDDSDKKMVPVS